MVLLKSKTISKEELKKKLDLREEFILLNVLEPEGYKLGVIKGSKKIPLTQLDKRLNELDKTKEIITYCAGVECTASREAAEKLVARGFRARAYEGGIKEWVTAKYPLEKMQ